ncbi:hypothetical protein FS749_001584, partial [Ceratobasidium sp. UAMH 11750]
MSTHGQLATEKHGRMQYACLECNHRKLKCDLKIPCAPCVQRGMAGSCRYLEDSDGRGSLHACLARLEHLDRLSAHENTAPRSHPLGSPDVRSSMTLVTTERHTTGEREEHLDGRLNGAAGNYFDGNALPS